MEKRGALKLRILNAEPYGYSDKARKILLKIGEVREEQVLQKSLYSKVKNFDVLIVRLGLCVDKNVLNASDRLKVIVTATTGTDHIDLETARKRNITILSLQGEEEFLRNITATAEYTWAIILSLVRKIPWAFNDICQGNWRRDIFRGHALFGKHLGILGLGRVGRQVAGYGLAFGMEVGYLDLFKKEDAKKLHYFKKIEDFLRWSQILSIHVSLNESSFGLLNEKLLRLLPKGAYLINTSRGACLEEQALLKLLKNGHISAAALDVLTEEQRGSKRRKDTLTRYACQNDRLLITPHLGGATFESMEKTEIFMAQKLHNFLKGNYG